jgi:Bacterial Ig-like domain
VKWTFPDNNATGVALRQSIRVQFDRFLAPQSPVRQAICVESTSVGGPDAGPDRCLSGSLSPQYDPVDRVAVWTPTVDLTPNLRYNVKILAPANADDPSGIRAFDGAPLEEEFVFSFTTGDGTNAAVEPKRTIAFCDVAPQLCTAANSRNSCRVPARDSTANGPFRIFQSCADGNVSCHGPATIEGAGPFGGALQLQTEDDIRSLVQTAQVATETATGPDPLAPHRSVGSAFGRNMPYIDAKSPANSYLLYKIIVAAPPHCPLDPNEDSPYNDPSFCSGSGYNSPAGFSADLYECASVPDAGRSADGGCLAPPATARKYAQGDLVPAAVEPWIPPDKWTSPAPGEYERLRQRIRGEPMPFGDGVTSRSTASNLSAWIAAGAEVSTCSAF